MIGQTRKQIRSERVRELAELEHIFGKFVTARVISVASNFALDLVGDLELFFLEREEEMKRSNGVDLDEQSQATVETYISGQFGNGEPRKRGDETELLEIAQLKDKDALRRNTQTNGARRLLFILVDVVDVQVERVVVA